VTTLIISSGGDAVGAQRGDERARGRADVDIELVDAAVDRQQIERSQRADLIDAACEPAAAEHQRRLVPSRTPAPVDRSIASDAAGGGQRRPALLRRNLGLIRRFQL